MIDAVKKLCKDYYEGFGCDATNLVYHIRLNTPKGIAVLSSPEEIAQRMVRGKPMPYGYGSGIQDVPLENGHFLFALCDAYDATADDYFADMAKKIFRGMKLVATVSPVAGFVPRGPHPDGKSYYPNSSRDQHAAFVEAMWRFYRSPLSTAEDRTFIAEKLDAVARRMERNGWKIMVEDGSEMAHVGFCWLQRTSVGALTLLSVLAEVYDATRDEHWRELYEQFSKEDGGFRWKELLHPNNVDNWPPLTLYSNQFAVGLAALARIERDASRREQLQQFLKRLAERALESNVFDERYWRRLDWADAWSEEETERNLELVGLSLRKKATVFDLYRAFNPEHWASKNWRQKGIAGKLCFGLPTVAFHIALLSGDERLIDEVTPCVEDMVRKMLEHGHLYTVGEDFNRAVVLGLHLIAERHRRARRGERRRTGAEPVEMRPHHFVDILRAIGAGREFKPHPYGHAVHSVAKMLMDAPDTMLKLVNKCDEICAPCVHNIDGICNDYLHDRGTSKHNFNTALDARLFDRLGIAEGTEMTAREFCLVLRERFGDASRIWTHLPAEEAEKRREMLMKGIERFVGLR